MKTRIVRSVSLLTTILFLCACGTLAPEETSTPIPPTPTQIMPASTATNSVAATATSIPLPPYAGATFVGIFDMGDKAQKAELTLKASEDGRAFVYVKLDFTDITCEGFTSGFTKASVKIENNKIVSSITDGTFEIKMSNLAEIVGSFDSPTTLKGTIHLMGTSGPLGMPAECGTWEWTAQMQ